MIQNEFFIGMMLAFFLRFDGNIRRGTTILIEKYNDRVLIAADTRVLSVSPSGKIDILKMHKIKIVNNIAFACSGWWRYQGIYDVESIVAKNSDKPFDSFWSLVNIELKVEMNKALQNAKSISDEYFSIMLKDGYIQVVFINIADEHIIVLHLRFNGENSVMNITNEVGGTKLGRYAEIDKYFLNNDGSIHALPKVKAFEFLIGLEASQNEDVGLPVDVLEVKSGKYSWLQLSNF